MDEILAKLTAEDTDVDPIWLALLFAKDESPDLDLASHLELLRSWGKALQPNIAGLPLLEQVTALSDYLFVELGFTGNREHYYDPRNSYLNEVMKRRLGIPITLSLIAMGVGQRAGMDVCGIGLPGHFIAMARDGNNKIFFDPFDAGRLLDEADCLRLMRERCGAEYPWSLAQCAPATPHFILSRMCNNLRAIYLKHEDYHRAERVLHRLGQLHPGVAELRRDLGICHLHTNRPCSAITHLTAYLEQETMPRDAELVQAMLRRARHELAKRN